MSREDRNGPEPFVSFVGDPWELSGNESFFLVELSGGRNPEKVSRDSMDGPYGGG